MNYFHYIPELLLGIWDVTGQMAPYLLFGFFVAGVLSVFVSASWVERHLGGRGIVPVVKSVLFGVPLPLCSCGVIAVTASIRRHGASKGAATGFLLATPQTGVDSIIATWGLMGPVFGIFRPLIALVTGIIGGGVVSLFERDQDSVAQVEAAEPTGSSCGDGCCETGAAEKKRGLSRAWAALRYGFVTLPRDIGRPLIVGIILAAVIGTLLPQDVLAPYLGSGLLAMLIMVIVGIPLYVCSTASIPVAIGFMHLGASPGAALAFLIAGPATNAATFTTVWKVLGRRTALIYIGTVFIASMAFGLGLDALYGVLDTQPAVLSSHVHGEEGGWLIHLSALALVTVVLGSMLPTRWWNALTVKDKESEPMPQSLVLKVTGMTCSHCSGAVERGLRETPGVTGASVDLESGKATVQGERLDADALAQIVRDLGYGAEPQGSGA